MGFYGCSDFPLRLGIFAPLRSFPGNSGRRSGRKAEKVRPDLETVDGDELRFEARTATDQIYDSFRLKKRPGMTNKLIEALRGRIGAPS